MAKIGRNSPCPCGSGAKYKKCCAASNQRKRPIAIPIEIPHDRIQAIHIDEEAKLVLIATNDMLINQLRRDAVTIAESFDKCTEYELKPISALIGDALGILAPQLIKFRADDEGLLPTCARLLKYAVETYMASAHVARGGYRRQYGILSRAVVETLAIVLHLYCVPDDLSKFNEGNLKSSKTINTAKKALPPFGELYGHLSNLFVHIGKFQSKFSTLSLYEHKEEALPYIVSNMRLNAWLIYTVIELVFLTSVAYPRYWREVGRTSHGTQFAYDPSEAERAWMKAFFKSESSADP